MYPPADDATLVEVKSVIKELEGVILNRKSNQTCLVDWCRDIKEAQFHIDKLRKEFPEA